MSIARSCQTRRRDTPRDETYVTICNIKRPSPSLERALLELFRCAVSHIEHLEDPSC